MKIKRATLSVTTLDEESRSFEVVASTDALDSHGEVVKQDWKLGRYQANPVVFFGHDSGGLPIGKASDVRVDGGALKARVTLVSEKANPLAEQVMNLIREGALSGISVGFRPGRRSIEKVNGRDVVTLSQNELLELSVVGVPANPEARAKDHGQHGAGAMENRMQNITKALGLKSGTSEEDVEKAFDSIADEILSATGAKSLSAVAGAVEVLKASLEANREKAAKLDALEAQLKAEREQAAKTALETTLDEAVKSGRVTPAKRAEYAEKAAKFGHEWLTTLVAELPIHGGDAVAAKALGADTTTTAIDAELKAALLRNGLTEDDYRAAKLAGHV